MYASPWIESLVMVLGDDVPIPTFPEFLSTQRRGDDDPTDRNGDTTGFVNMEGVDDPMKNEPAIDDVAVVDVDVRLGMERAV